VFVTAMIPTPGEAPADWWANTGHAAAGRKLGELDAAETDANARHGHLESFDHGVGVQL
jgi:hypothetical protein